MGYYYEPIVRVQTEEHLQGFDQPVDELPTGERNGIEYTLTRLQDDLPIEGPLSPRSHGWPADYRNRNSQCRSERSRWSTRKLSLQSLNQALPMSTITRRDFVNGTLMAAGATLRPFRTDASDVLDTLDPTYYPPSRTGLRGSHEGSNKHAHSMALDGRTDWGPTTALSEVYDLIVVGGGISGLAAAYFYQQRHGREKKVLILDNHDDFGGHAKRNEHTINGKTRITYGGSQTLVDPLDSGRIVRALLTDIGIDLDRFKTAYDVDFYKRHNLGAVTYFNKDTFGEDKVVKHPFCNYPNYVEGIQGAKLSNEEAA
jgi:spermidine dehydrogenase